METPAKTIRVTIYGDEYPLKSEGDTDLDYMTRVADHVDRAMRKIADRSPSLPPAKVAILAALNITDEFFSAQRESEGKMTGVQQRAQALRAMLDARLGDDARSKSSDSPSRLARTA